MSSLRQAMIALLLMSLAGCDGSSSPVTSTTSTHSETPVTLRLYGYGEEEYTSGGAATQHFIDTLGLIEPSLTVTPVWDQVPDEEGAARAVLDGTADLGLVSSRGWDDAGVTGLRAVETPFLVDSTRLLSDVVRSDLGSTMLGRLADSGAVGLALVPEGLWYPMGATTPMRRPEDFRGRRILTPKSPTAWALLRALGASPVYATDVRDGSVSLLDLAAANIATGNVAFGAKVDALAINAATAARLSPAQLDAVRRAAAATTAWATRHLPTGRDAAQGFCLTAGQTVSAEAADVAALRAAAQPVVDRLDRDPTTRADIAAIRRMKAQIGPAPSVNCPGQHGSPGEYDGTYRSVVTVHALRRAGVTDEGALADVPGVWTWRLDRGILHVTQRHTSGPDRGTVSVQDVGCTSRAGLLEIFWNHEYDPASRAPVARAGFAVSVEPDASLGLTHVGDDGGDPTGFLLDSVVLRHWTRID